MSIAGCLAGWLNGDGLAHVRVFQPAAAQAILSLRVMPYTAGLLLLGGTLMRAQRRSAVATARQQQEAALLRESLAYMLFNGSPRSLAPIDFGRQISRLVTSRSSFAQAALMLRDASGVLRVTGSCGFDDLSVAALHRWSWASSAKGATMETIVEGATRVGTASFSLQLERRNDERSPLTAMRSKRVHIIPLRTADALLGALVVDVEVRPEARVHDPFDLVRPRLTQTILPLADLLQPLEALALRLTMQLTAPENLTPLWPVNRTHRRHRRHMVTVAAPANAPAPKPAPRSGAARPAAQAGEQPGGMPGAHAARPAALSPAPRPAASFGTAQGPLAQL